MPLTNVEVKVAQPRAKDYKLTDSGGLHLFVTTRGHKSWRLRYDFGGKEKRLLLGSYPDVTLARARELRDDAKRLLREHRDPAMEAHKRKIAAHAAAGATFEKYALLWHEAQKGRWSPVQVKKVEQALRRDVFPDLGRVPLVEIDGPMVLKVLRKVEKRGAIDTAKRIRQHVSAVFQFAMAEGVAGTDPAAGIEKALLPTPPAASSRRSSRSTRRAGFSPTSTRRRQHQPPSWRRVFWRLPPPGLGSCARRPGRSSRASTGIGPTNSHPMPRGASGLTG